jgi:hypothetical protein
LASQAQQETTVLKEFKDTLVQQARPVLLETTVLKALKVFKE